MAKDDENKKYGHLNDEQKEYFKKREEDWAAIDARNKARRSDPNESKDISIPAIPYSKYQNNDFNKGDNLNSNDNKNSDKSELPKRTEAKESQFNTENSNNKQLNKKHVYHVGFWISGIIIALFLLLGFGIYSQVKQLSNTERTHDTLIDDAIKHEAKRVVQKKAPANIRPQIINLINTTPLSDLQQAANNQKLFNQIAASNDIPQSYINKANKNWFNNQSMTQTRQAIQNGKLIKSIKDLEEIDFSKLNQNNLNKPNVNSSAANSN